MDTYHHKGIIMKFKIKNRYGGPRKENWHTAGRIPKIDDAKENRGWKAELENARTLACIARERKDPMEKTAFALMAIVEYEHAVWNMKAHNKSRKLHDPQVDAEIKKATAEKKFLKLQFGIKD